MRHLFRVQSVVVEYVRHNLWLFRRRNYKMSDKVGFFRNCNMIKFGIVTCWL